MRRRRLLILAIVVALPACGLIAGLDKDFEEVACLRDCADAVSEPTSDTTSDATSPSDATADAIVDADAGDADSAPPACNLNAPFGTPVLVAGLGEREVYSARFTSKENLVIFTTPNGCAADSCFELITAERAGLNAPFVVIGPLGNVSGNNSPEYWPTLTADNKLLYFESTRLQDGAPGANSRIWAATRVNEIDLFNGLTLHPIFDVAGIEQSPYLHPDATHLYFASLARVDGGNSDLFVTELTAGGPKEPQNLGAPNTDGAEFAPLVTRQHTKLYFGRGQPKRDIFLSTREGTDASFGAANPVSDLNTADDDYPSWISDDECRFYFISNRPSGTDAAAGLGLGYRLWVATRPK